MKGALTSARRGCVWLLVLIVAGAGCAVAPKPPPAERSVEPPPSAEPAPEVTPPGPEPLSSEAKAESRERALRALELLDAGQEAAAQRELAEARRLDPGSELAQSLLHQINVNPQQELGSVYFNYTIRPEDSLSKLAQRFLGDKYRFYILARYNDISAPNRVHTGQVIKIPGEAPKSASRIATPPKPVQPPRPVEPPRPAEGPKPAVKPTPPPSEDQPATGHEEAEQRYRQALIYRRNGDLSRAYDSLAEASRLDPNHQAATQLREEIRQDLITRYHKEAMAAFHRQDLDGAIKGWNTLLKLDPANETALLNRARALELKERLKRFD